MNATEQNFIEQAAAPSSPPPVLQSALEFRAAIDIAQLPLTLGGAWVRSQFSLANAPTRSEPVMMFPGFGTDELSMRPLELFLRRKGFATHGWGLGKNLAGNNYPHTLDDLDARWELDLAQDFEPSSYKGEGGVPYLCDRAIEQVEQRFREAQQPFALVGWSLGGYVAREVARALGPQKVSRVITLCSPVIGGPRYTRAVSVFEAKGFDLDWIERAINKQNEKPIEQPITIIYSKSDGVVNWRAMMDKMSPNVEHFELNVSHLGVGFNRKAWRLVLNALEQS